MRQQFLIAGLATLLTIVAACGGDTAPTSTATSEPTEPQAIRVGASQAVTVGISSALSGDQINLGTDIADAAELAVADFGGNIKGHAIRVRRMDDGCTDAEKAQDVAHQFIEDGAVIGVIGPMCTTGAQAANDEYERAGIVHLSPSATRVDLSAQEQLFFFRTSWRDDVQAKLQASHARDVLRARTAVVIDDGDPYGRGLADEFAGAFEAAGGQVLTRERIVRGTTDFAPLVRQVVAAAPDVVVFEGLNPEGALIVKALREGEYGGAFMAPDGLLSLRDFLEVAGAGADDAIVTGGPTPDEEFVQRFEERFGRRPSTPFVLQTHDAVTMLLRAVEAAATEGPRGELVVEREEIAKQLRALTYDGLTGRIRFNERGDRSGERAGEVGLRIYRVTDGRFEPID